MLRLTQTSLIAAVGFGAVWISAMASCSDEDPDNLLTTVSTGTMTGGGEAGPTTTVGGGGAGADGGGATGGNPTTGGNGGTGGVPEEVINGCTTAMATDRTGEGQAITVTYPGGQSPICILVVDGTSVQFDTPAPPATDLYRIVYGTQDGGVKSPRIPSGCTAGTQTNCPNWVFCNGVCTPEPHYCPNSPYDCNEPGPTGPLNKVAANEQIAGYGVFPFYDDSQSPGTVQGVIYVQ